jgi:hypothetical protein
LQIAARSQWFILKWKIASLHLPYCISIWNLGKFAYVLYHPSLEKKGFAKLSFRSVSVRRVHPPNSHSHKPPRLIITPIPHSSRNLNRKIQFYISCPNLLLLPAFCLRSGFRVLVIVNQTWGRSLLNSLLMNPCANL